MGRRVSLILGVLSLVVVFGCSKDEGTMVSDADVARLKQEQAANIEKQIKNVESNPNLSAGQKQNIIGTIRAGAARAAAGTQSGQASGSKK